MSDTLAELDPEEYRAAEALARRFHEAYERLAPSFSYSPREETSVPWEQVPDNNRLLMIATAHEIRRTVVPDRDTPHVLQGPGPCLFIDGDRKPIHDMYTAHPQTALDHAVAAERLGLGWVLSSYRFPDDIEHDRSEYRMTAWRRLTSEIGARFSH
jgi:hypothetical protein